MSGKQPRRQKLSKIDLEISDDLQFEDGDSCVIIKRDGSVGRVVMPKMDHQTLVTPGYKKLLDVLEFLHPGARNHFISYNKGKYH